MPTDPAARVIQNLLALQRLGNTVSDELRSLYQDTFSQIVSDLQRLDPTEPVRLKWRAFRVEQIVEQAAARLKAAQPDAERLLRQRLAEIGRAQGQWAEGTLVASLGTTDKIRATPVTQNMVKAILDSEPFGGTEKSTALMAEWSSGLTAAARKNVDSAIRFHMHIESDLPTMVRAIRGRALGGKFVGGLLDVTTRQAEAIARTGINFISNRAFLETYKANQDILAGVRFTSVLDDRTTVICASLDGTFWPLDYAGIETPPLHPNCRSVLVPEIAWDKLGVDPPPDSPRVARDLSDVEDKDLDRKVSARRRTSDLGARTDVPSATTYADWLKRQRVSVQEHVLGVGKARLFREGKVALRDLIRKDRSLVPLSELSK